MKEKIKCISCFGWEWDAGDINDWDTCPKCDFPRKYIGWIEHLQSEIEGLRGENARLQRKLKGIMSDELG